MSTDTQVAHQTVLHGAQHPSALLLSVTPASGDYHAATVMPAMLFSSPTSAADTFTV